MAKKNILFIMLVTVISTLAIVTAIRYLPIPGIGAAVEDVESVNPLSLEGNVSEGDAKEVNPFVDEKKVQQSSEKEHNLAITEIKQTKDLDAVLQLSGPVVLKLYAPWCGACKMADKIMPDIVTLFAGKVKIYALDVTHNDLIQQALEKGLLKDVPRSIPTFVFIDKDHDVHEAHVGYMHYDAMVEKIKAVFYF